MTCVPSSSASRKRGVGRVHRGEPGLYRRGLPHGYLLLSAMGAFAEFERSLTRERQKEGNALAKQRGAYKGRKRTLTPERAPSWPSGPAATVQKSSLLAITGAAGSRSTSICAKPGCREAPPLPSPTSCHSLRSVRYRCLSGTSRSSCPTARLGTRAGLGGTCETRDRRHIKCLPNSASGSSYLCATFIVSVNIFRVTGNNTTYWTARHRSRRPEKLEKS